MPEMPTYHDDADGTLWGSPTPIQKSETKNPNEARSPKSESAIRYSGLDIVPSGSSAAGEVAARISGKRKARILQLLRNRGPLTLWELAEAMSCQVHQISGRISELKFDGQILETGLHRHPVSGIWCAVYAISVPSSSSAQSAVKPSSPPESR